MTADKCIHCALMLRFAFQPFWLSNHIPEPPASRNIHLQCGPTSCGPRSIPSVSRRWISSRNRARVINLQPVDNISMLNKLHTRRKKYFLADIFIPIEIECYREQFKISQRWIRFTFLWRVEFDFYWFKSAKDFVPSNSIHVQYKAVNKI